MTDTRDIPKSTVWQCNSDRSEMLSGEGSPWKHNNVESKSLSSASTFGDVQSVILHNLIDDCTKGAYSAANRSKRTRQSTTQPTTTTATNINNNCVENGTTQRKNRKWTPKDVKRLHRCVQIFGTDFSIISKMFPERKRSQLMVACPINQNKFKKEGKINGQAVEKTFSKHLSMRLTKHVGRKNSLRKESLVSVNSLDSADIKLVNEVRCIVNKDDTVGETYTVQ